MASLTKCALRLVIFAIAASISAFSYSAAGDLRDWEARLRFEHIFEVFPDTLRPHGTLPFIAQDHKGMMWFAGEHIYRYDGSQIFTYVLHETPECASFTLGITVDHDGVIWLATEQGLCQYHPASDSFKPFTISGIDKLNRHAAAVKVSPNNEIYIGYAGEIGIINAERTHASFYDSPLKEAYANENNEYRALYFEDASNLWIGSLSTGFIHFDTEAHLFTHFMNNAENPSFLPSNDVRALATDTDGNLWVGMHQGGISKLSPDRKTIKHYWQEGDPYELGSAYVWSLSIDSTGQLWLTSDGGGLLGYDKTKDRFFAFKHKPNDSNTIASDKPLAIFEDNNGNLWVSLYPRGIDLINRSDNNIQRFHHSPKDPLSLNDDGILTIFEDSQYHIWIGTEKGLNQYNPEHHYFENYSAPSAPWSVPPKPITAMAEDKYGDYWFSTWGSGVFRVNPSTQTTTHYPPMPGIKGKNDVAILWEILAEDDMLIFGNEGATGLLTYDLKREKFVRIPLADGNTQVFGKHMYYVLRDKSGNLWIGTIGGLYRQTPAGKLTPLSNADGDERFIKSDRIRSLFEAHDGNIWVATEDQGVFIYSVLDERFTQISQKDGLPSNNVTKIQQDPNNTFWLFTRNGLAHYTPPTGAMRVFGQAQGLADANFNRGAGYIDAKGTVYAGSSNGLSIFHRDDLAPKIKKFPVHITQLRIFNRIIQAGSAPLTQGHILDTDKITLTHNDDVFTLSYAALSYPLARWNQYVHKLEGYDKDWHNVGRQASATYTNIPAGRYTFVVRAQDSFGNWSDQQDTLEIVILPPPWLTWWAFCLYAIAAIVIFQMALHFRFQTLRYKKEKQLNAEIIRLNAVKEAIRRDYMADISHEIRTPLAILTGEIEAVQEGIRPLSADTIESISSEVSLIKNIVSDLHDLALSDTGTLKFSFSNINLTETLERTIEQMRIRIDQARLTLDYTPQHSLIWVRADEQRLQQVFINLLENAIRYTHSPGQIHIRVSLNHPYCNIRIEDSAPSIPESAMTDIFKRFYRVDESRNRASGGSGLGLAICKTIIQAHQGDVYAKPSPLGGLCIVIQLPLLQE